MERLKNMELKRCFFLLSVLCLATALSDLSQFVRRYLRQGKVKVMAADAFGSHLKNRDRAFQLL